MTQRTFLQNRTHVPGTKGSTGQPRRIPHQRRPTVDPALVHRPVAHDVLPTAWRQVADSRFQVDVRWPEEPRLFRPDDGLHSPLIIAETMRQSAILLTHTAFGVPLDHRFVLQDLRYTVGRDFLPVNGPTNDVAVEVACSAIRGGRRPTAMHCRVTLRRGTARAEGEGELGITSPRPTAASAANAPPPNCRTSPGRWRRGPSAAPRRSRCCSRPRRPKTAGNCASIRTIPT